MRNGSARALPNRRRNARRPAEVAKLRQPAIALSRSFVLPQRRRGSSFRPAQRGIIAPVSALTPFFRTLRLCASAVKSIHSDGSKYFTPERAVLQHHFAQQADGRHAVTQHFVVELLQ